MQAVIDWIVAHQLILVMLVYEGLSLIPDSVIKSSSILTFIYNAVKGLKDKLTSSAQ